MVVKQNDGAESLQMDLDKLTESERVIILNVLQRDDEIQKGRDQKLSELKNEIHGIRLKGVLREGDSADHLCARCHQPLGRIFNTGDFCQQCRFKVCQKCREITIGKKWLCILCYKQRQISLLTGDWYLPKDIKDGQKNSLTAPDLIRASMRQPRMNGDVAHSSSSETSSHRQYPLNGNFSCPRSKDIRMLQQLTHSYPPDQDVDHVDAGLVVRRVVTNRYKDSDTDDDRSYDENRNNSNSRSLVHQDSGIASAELNGTFDDASLSSDSSYYQRVKPTSRVPVEENFIVKSPENASALSSLTSSPSPSQRSVNAEINPVQHQSTNMTPRNKDFEVEELTHVKFHRLSKKSSGSSKDDVSSPGHPGAISSPEFDDVGNHHRTALNHQSKSLSSIPSIVVSNDGEDDDIFDDDQLPSHRSGSSISSLNWRGSSHTGSLESLSSVYSSAGVSYGVVPVTGAIQFGLEYKLNTGQLDVFIRQASEVSPVDRKRLRSDPYVKAYLLPDKSRASKRKTRIKRHTLNPVFNEKLTYHISNSELKSRVLSVSVWHFDRFGRNVFLGEVILALDYFDFSESSPHWYTLREKSELHQPEQESVLSYKGDLDVAIKYMTAEEVVLQNAENKKSPKSATKRKVRTGELHLFIKEARNLTPAKSQGYSDPFCRVRLLPEKSRQHKHKTPIIRKDCNPKWEFTFCFDGFSLKQLKECSLEVTVWDYDRFSSNEFLGGVRLNLGTGTCHGKEVEWMDAKGEEISMWQAMLDNPSVWIDYNLVLRPNMDKRK